jgi:hypothetical protein
MWLSIGKFSASADDRIASFPKGLSVVRDHCGVAVLGAARGARVPLGPLPRDSVVVESDSAKAIQPGC